MSVPRATYRLQLTPELDFAAVRALVPYLRELGVSHLYLSPSLQARSGSTHGYDVVDPSRVSDALGGEAGLRALAAEGLGIVLDIVPNHMGVGDENRWWVDLALRERFFDWDPADGWYRRFFDIDDLAGLRVEDPDVFEATHAKVLELVRDGVVDGLRVDHPDGLADPAGYLRRLRDAGVPLVWVEKILSAADPVEQLPADWPVAGTVGYEFLNDATALFVDPAGEAALTELASALTGDARPFHAVALEAQVEQATTTFAREVARLRTLLDVDGIAEALAALPVYRTYVSGADAGGRGAGGAGSGADSAGASGAGAAAVTDADRAAVEASGATGRLRAALLLEERGHDEFVTRFQQTSPPVTAKGIEDTAFYRYVRLLALNDVGGEPARFSLSVADFHAAQVARAQRFPHGLLETQTHDTKRGGDVRARIGALAGMAEAWREHVLRWRELNSGLRGAGGAGAGGPGAGGATGPDPTEEYLIYQTLVGAYPISPERLSGYLVKALREGKRTTSWVAPDEAHEQAVTGFATALLEHRPFLDDFEPFLAQVVVEGRRSALGQLLLKLTVPGVPDLYQGDELEALNLVDPDNRRPVDWERRRELLARVRAGEPAADYDAQKLTLIVRALELRARREATFGDGAHRPLEAGDGVCAFARGDDVLVVVGVRDWDGATLTLPADLRGQWRSVLDGRDVSLADATVAVGDVTDAHGLALLERAPGA